MYSIPPLSHRRSFPVLGLAISLIVTLAGSTALGQEEAAAEPTKDALAADGHQYEKLKVDDSQKRKRSDISAIFRAGKFEGEQQAAFETYYKTYFFPLWSDSSNFGSVSSERAGRDEVKMKEDLRRDLGNDFKAAKSGPVHARLLSLSLEALSSLAKGNYHPVSRVNAMLMLGELNETEPAKATDPPVAAAAALPILLDAIKDPKQPDAVKIAALRGLVRHSYLRIADQQVRDATVIPLMIQLATTRVSPGRSADGQAWMRIMAMEVLGNIHSPGAKGEVVQALLTVAAEADGPLWVRSAAAKTLGMLDYQPGTLPLNPQQMAAVVNDLLVEACTQATKPNKQEIIVIRRRELKEQENCVRIALEGQGEGRKGIQSLATTDAQKTVITSLLEQIQKINTLLDNRDELEDSELAERLNQAAAKLRQTLPPVAAPAKVAPVAKDAAPAAKGAAPATKPAAAPGIQPADAVPAAKPAAAAPAAKPAAANP